MRNVRKESASHRKRRPATSPQAHTSRQHDAESLSSSIELRRSTRLVNSLPRSDYSLSERWSYGTDVYETRYDTLDSKHGDIPHTAGEHSKRRRTSLNDKKKGRKRSSSRTTECVAYCTRSRTALKPESVCEPPKSISAQAPQRPLHLAAAATAAQRVSNQSEGGLLPLDERDYAYSPFSSSTVTDLLDSDYSVYSPTASRRKGKKRKRPSHRSLSNRKSGHCLLGSEEPKKSKVERWTKETAASKNTFGERGSLERHSAKVPPGAPTCTYSLRKRYNRDLGPPSSTVVNDTSGKYLIT